VVVGVADVTLVSHGVGGSYTMWQSKPPANMVFMARHDDKWTTITVHHRDGDIVNVADGAMGPNGIPFAHDVDMEDLPELVLDDIMTDIRGVVQDA